MALCKLCGSSEIFSSNRGVVQALCRGEVDCISAGHNGAHLRVLVLSMVGECIGDGFNMRVVFTKAHTPRLRRKPK